MTPGAQQAASRLQREHQLIFERAHTGIVIPRHRVAQRLTGHIRDGATVARHGGDEFVVMQSDLQHGIQNQEFVLHYQPQKYWAGRFRHRQFFPCLPQASAARPTQDRPVIRAGNSDDPNDAAIVRTILALADVLGLAVIDEGVETEGQRIFLAGYGCHAYQGYFYSRPLPLPDLAAFMRRG